MTPNLTRLVLVFAIVSSGFLAGLNFDRTLVVMPAWHQAGANAWAVFSRHADLGNGRILYPLEGFGSLLLAVAAGIGIHADRNAPRAAAILLDLAVLLLVGGLVLTAKAAPVMLGIQYMSDPAMLQHAFEEFWYWGNWRGACQLMAFIVQTATLGVLSRRAEAPVMC